MNCQKQNVGVMVLEAQEQDKANKYNLQKELDREYQNEIEKIKKKYNCDAECCCPNTKINFFECYSCGNIEPCEKYCEKIKYHYLKEYKLLEKTYDKISWNDIYELFSTVLSVAISIFFFIIAFLIAYIFPMLLILIFIVSFIE